MSKKEQQKKKEEEEIEKQIEAAFLSLTEDGGVRKLIVAEGDGIHPKEGQDVAIMYSLALTDGTLVADTFTSKQPLKLKIGGEASIRGVEIAIKTMRFGEKARLEVSPEYGFGAMDNKWGFHGSGIRIPPNSKLIFTEIHLLPIEMAFPRTTKQWIEQAEECKTEGNKAFSEKDDEKAKTEYEKALKIIETILKQLQVPRPLEGKSEEEKKKIEEEKKENEAKTKALLIACHNNLAAVHLRNNRFDSAKEHCKKALEQDPQNTKTLFRLAQANKGLEQYELAVEQLQTAADIQNTKEIQKELAECKKLQKQKLEREKKIYSGMFSKLGNEGLYEGVEPGKAELWKCHYCGEEMEYVQHARHILKKHAGKQKEDYSDLKDLKITIDDLNLDKIQSKIHE